MVKGKWTFVLAITSFAVGALIMQILLSKRGGGVLSATDSLSVDDRLTSLENRVWNLEKNSGLVRAKGSGKTSEQFVNLTGGSTSSSDWGKISGSEFYFDTALYGKSVEVSWQGWIEKEGVGGVRLYDATNHRVVDYSEQVVNSSGKSSFYSKPLSIWRGQNLYYLEGKSVSGAITVTSPRLRVVTK